mmetsp:Transcript_17036/g.42071  ORF Transcript_17036/g.42071 Transcript_17036/m.42071 type:complete len:97 (-) Transcript_17036:276-566(-)
MELAEGNYMEAIKGVLVKRSPNELLCGTSSFFSFFLPEAHSFECIDGAKKAVEQLLIAKISVMPKEEVWNRNWPAAANDNDLAARIAEHEADKVHK